MIFILTFPLAFAQHHGGEQAPPISFGSGQVTVSTSLIPADFIPGKNPDVNLKIRFFDISTNKNIQSVTYRVQIFYGTQLVANQMFFDKDGELDIKIQPRPECAQEELWKCTKYQGENDPVVPNALTSSKLSTPIITGPVFSTSGQYMVKTSIIGATNPRTQTSEDITFETSITIPQEQQFMITSSNTQYSFIVKNFQELITNFQYDESINSIVFQMPFDWEHMEHIDSVKNNIEIPKDFPPFQNVNGFKGTINDVPIFSKNLHYDKHSSKNSNTIHLTIENTELKQLKQTTSGMKVVITPNSQLTSTTKDLFFDNGFKASVSYDSKYSQSKDNLFSIAFFDSKGDVVSGIRYGYSVKDPLGKEIVNTGTNPSILGINLPNGVDSQVIHIPVEGKYKMQLVLIGIGANDFDRFIFKDFEFEILKSETSKSIPSAVKSEIPEWIKNNAGWWASDKIDDNSFVQGIQFLIKNKLLNVPPTSLTANSDTNEIPSWIKNNAGWWASGDIDDGSFIQGLQYLIKIGIIRV